MANAYFCNCTKEEISVNLNYEVISEKLNVRNFNVRGNINELWMTSFPIVAYKQKGEFGLTDTNDVSIEFSTSNNCDYQVTTAESLVDQDLIFYVAVNYLIGTNKAGDSAGISIDPMP